MAYRTGTWASFRQSMIDLVPVLADHLAVEDVDLVAQERAFGYENPLLFELLNELEHRLHERGSSVHEATLETMEAEWRRGKDSPST